jgi:exonuclease SbcD
MPPLRLLLLSDTHLGFDMPARPRTSRRRRGPDFFGNFREALQPALEGEVDAVLHGGDFFYRSRVQAGLVQMALDEVLKVTSRGIPFLVVPGNHERSALPFPLLWNHPGIHVFHRPRTVRLDIRGVRASFSGFPSVRDGIRGRFGDLTESTGWRDRPADVRVLCMHQTVEGAAVGPHGFVFRDGPDVVPLRMIPGGFAAVLTGHFHPHQVITGGRAPVIYPGSTERTSFAERGETKGFMVLGFEPTPDGTGILSESCFRSLDCRPMVDLGLDLEGLRTGEAGRELARSLAGLHPESVVRIDLRGTSDGGLLRLFSRSGLRDIAPGMSISLRFDRKQQHPFPESK